MSRRCVISTLSILVVLFVSTACTGSLQPTATSTRAPTTTPEPTFTPLAREVSIRGPDCNFQTEHISQDVEIGATGSLTLTLGSTPSIACGWHSPEISEPAIVRQVDHQSKWPAEGATPMPGAPGTEIWLFETLKAGESTISLECVCLGEEGSEEKVSGVFVLDVTVKK